MRPEQAGELLAELGFTDTTAVPITGGWASWTFDVADGRILRVARNPEIAASHRREARLLPALARAVDFAVPVPSGVGVFRGLTYMVYAKLPGRSFEAGDDLDSVTGLLRGLREFPVAEAARLLGCGTAAADWQHDYRHMWGTWVQDLVLPVLDAPLRRRAEAAFTAILPELAAISPALTHRDLGREHILVDPDTRRATGMIDFETATVGDPDIDLIGLLLTAGEAATRRVIEKLPGEVSWPRLRFYAWMGAVHAIHHGIEEGDAELVADATANLRHRLTQ